jgi:hypothetical protein
LGSGGCTKAAAKACCRAGGRCLEKDPNRRYPDVVSFDQALGACESAGQWSAERAEEWWRQHGESLVPPPSPDAVDRDGQTVLLPNR